jgi:molecular chaperone GrpE
MSHEDAPSASARIHADANPKPTNDAADQVADPREQQLAELALESAQLHDRLLRTAAELDNYRKRALREIEDATRNGRDTILRELLPVFDNVERAIAHAPTTDDPLARGVRLIDEQLLGALRKFGIARFTAAGEAFDPARHEAIEQVQVPELAPGTVARVFASGYADGLRLLRPALVAVAALPAAAPAVLAMDSASRTDEDDE